MKLPKDNLVDVRKLARIYNNTSATYKFYWFLGILDEVEAGKLIIPKVNLFTKMISIPWYTVNYYKVSFGVQDKIQENTALLKNRLNLSVSEKRDRIESQLLKSADTEVKSLLWHFNKNVPYKFLTPWIGAGTDSEAKRKSKMLSNGCPYVLEDDRIEVRPEWAEYFKKHARILRDYTWWNLIDFVQRRNPGIPDIPLKLIRPSTRESLAPYRGKYWSIYLSAFPDTRCIFTGEKLTLNSYHVDHFIPHSFMPQNQVWNLVPIADSFNLQKSNRVPDLNKYFAPFFGLQKEAFNFLSASLTERQFKRYKDEFLTVYHTDEALTKFSIEPLRDTIAPQVTVALNNGFEKLT